jgi:hypothetical protein
MADHTEAMPQRPGLHDYIPVSFSVGREAADLSWWVQT